MLSNNKKQNSSKLKSFYLSCLGQLPCSNSSSSCIKALVNPISAFSSYEPTLASHKYKRCSMTCPCVTRCDCQIEPIRRQQVRELERELVDLEGWFGAELGRLKSHLRSKNYTYSDSYSQDSKFERLGGGIGYLYTFNAKKLHNGYCQDLVVQFSSPSLVPPEIGSNISQVLKQMAAMGKQNLITWLLESMPMIDVSINKNKTQKLAIKPCKTPNDLLEAILLNALVKFEYLLIEGFRIQKGDKVVKQMQEISRQFSKIVKEKTNHAADDTPVIMAMLIQARDPQKGYAAMNEMMIGFVEAEDNSEDEEYGFVIKGVHIAGLMARKRSGQVIHNCLWHISA